MWILTILVFALVSLAAAWAVNSFIGMFMGEKPGGLFSDWWDIFSKAGRNPATYAEPLPDVLKPGKFTVGSRIRLLPMPIGAEHAMTKERAELFRRCVGKVFRIDAIDQFGALEFRVSDDGSQKPDHYDHVLFIDPQFAEPASQ